MTNDCAHSLYDSTEKNSRGNKSGPANKRKTNEFIQRLRNQSQMSVFP